MAEIIQAERAIDCRNGLGEGPAWNGQTQRLTWSDNTARTLYEAGQDDDGTWRVTRQWLVDRRIGAAVPRQSGGFVVAAGMSILALDEDGAYRVFAEIPADDHPFHLNDAKCDPQGRLWTGTLDGDLNVAGRDVQPGRGGLFRIGVDGGVTQVLDGVTVSNGMAWNAENEVFYYVDSYRRSIDAFDYSAGDGSIRNRRRLVRFEPGDGATDGMSIDNEGALWIALPGIGEVRRYSDDGVLLATVRVPTITPTSCCFGGGDGMTLFITSARVILPKEALFELKKGFSVETPPPEQGECGGGALYRCRPGVGAPPAAMFMG